MGADVNSVTLVGRLTRDPEQRGGGTVLAMRLAFSASRKVGEKWEDVAQYVDVVTFGRQAEALSSLLEKGDQIAVAGRLAWREWQANDGTTRSSHEVVAERVQLLSKPRGKQDAAPAPARREDDDDDGLPF